MNEKPSPFDAELLGRMVQAEVPLGLPRWDPFRLTELRAAYAAGHTCIAKWVDDSYVATGPCLKCAEAEEAYVTKEPESVARAMAEALRLLADGISSGRWSIQGRRMAFLADWLERIDVLEV